MSTSDEGVTRRELAEMLGLHQDSVSRNMPDGLASAVMRWGGHGKEMQFSRALALRWHDAKNCRRRGGSPCAWCAAVLEDSGHVGKHLKATRHGAGGCEECRPPGHLCQPCRGRDYPTPTKWPPDDGDGPRTGSTTEE